jgi:indole-3-glycerol phosphate synthase
MTKLKGSLKKSERDFKAAIAMPPALNLIAEIKRSSPSDKHIFTGDFQADKIAAVYESSGADAISVLTDEKFFNGSLENLQLARSATKSIPLLMKDFIIDEYQIYLARHYGADAILLIAAILSREEIDHFITLARSLDMDVLLEVHNKQELAVAQKTSADIFGINNRDLHTFSIDPKTFLKLFHRIPGGNVIVAESGYTAKNTHTIQGLANAALIGTSIMKSKNMIQEIRHIKTMKKKFKACGIRSVEAAEYCEVNKIDMVGVNFVPESKRRVDIDTAKSICEVLTNTISVGIFQDESLEEVNRIAEEVGLDFVQLSGMESAAYCSEVIRPVIKTVSINNRNALAEYADVVSMFIIDGIKPGSGEAYDYSVLKELNPGKPFLVAGGVNETNVESILTELPLAIGVDTATGIESDGQVDLVKIEKIASMVMRF